MSKDKMYKIGFSKKELAVLQTIVNQESVDFEALPHHRWTHLVNNLAQKIGNFITNVEIDDAFIKRFAEEGE